jgi:hypothetical protein
MGVPQEKQGTVIELIITPSGWSRITSILLM